MDIETEIGRLLTIKGLTLSIAESCTGGLLCSRITDVPGSSAYFVGGVIAYSNRVKVQMLGVTQGALDTYGAVSEQVAIQMAKGVKQRFATDIGLGITGIAGPGGSPSDSDGNRQKPVGLVYLSLVSTAKKRDPLADTLSAEETFMSLRDTKLRDTKKDENLGLRNFPNSKFRTPNPSFPEEIICNKYKFIGANGTTLQRKDIRIQSTQTILEMLFEYLTR